MADDEGKGADPWRQRLTILAVVGPYMLILFWLWVGADYPDSFGVTVTAHGAAGLLENWWYSYLLLKRPDALDVGLFCYMWAPLVGLLGWVTYVAIRACSMKFKIFNDEEAPDDASS